MTGTYRSAAISMYHHTQASPSATWTINHKINSQHAIVDCFIDINSTLAQAIPLSVVSTTPGTTVVSWSEPQSGYATAV
jgi:multisubunit Na+/H+ antiporter MnhE subunit